MAIIPANAVDYGAICARLRSPEALETEDILKIREQVRDPEIHFDKNYKLKDVVERIYQALTKSRVEHFDEYSSTNGAQKVIDKSTGKVLFVSKSNILSEGRQFNVPDGKAIPREHLYYLLDRDNFAGVPPTFRVIYEFEYGSLIQSFNLFVENQTSVNFFSLRKELNAPLRRCFIHQFRTVNMDPTSGNILIPNDRKGSTAFPIDGGYCLPKRFARGRNDFDLISRHDTRIYFEDRFSEEEMAYIEKIDIAADKNLIRQQLPNVEWETLTVFEVANRILKKAVVLDRKSNPGEATVSVHDLGMIWETLVLDAPVDSFFEYILQDQEGDVESRIDRVFSDIVRVKTTIQSCQGQPLGSIFRELIISRPEKTNYARLVRKYSYLRVHTIEQYYELSRNIRERRIHLPLNTRKVTYA